MRGTCYSAAYMRGSRRDGQAEFTSVAGVSGAVIISVPMYRSYFCHSHQVARPEQKTRTDRQTHSDTQTNGRCHHGWVVCVADVVADMSYHTSTHRACLPGVPAPAQHPVAIVTLPTLSAMPGRD